MTDGIGYANGAFFKQIKDIMGWESLPQAVQGRYRGAKVSTIQNYPSTAVDILYRVFGSRNPGMKMIRYL